MTKSKAPAARTRKAPRVTLTFASLTFALPEWIAGSDHLMPIIRKAPAARTKAEREQLQEVFDEHLEREGLAPEIILIATTEWLRSQKSVR